LQLNHQPVKHGLVTRPEDYPYSSYRYWPGRGYYELGWRYSEPEDIKETEFEIDLPFRAMAMGERSMPFEAATKVAGFGG